MTTEQAKIILNANPLNELNINSTNLSEYALNEPNSKEQFLKYGTQSTIQTLWANFPKIKNKKDQELTELYTLENLQSLQKLETLLYSDGVAALKNDWTPAKVLDFIVYKNQIRQLKTQIELVSKNVKLIVIENWEYDKDNNLIFSYNLEKPLLLSENEALKKLESFGYDSITPKTIPYQIFQNNVLSKPDLDLIDNSLFEQLDNDFKVLKEDSFLSAPWIFINDSKATATTIKNKLHNLKDRTIPLNQKLAIFDTDPFRILQAQSQSPIIINKVDKTIAWIKKFGFMKQDSADFGTKNMHSAEVQEINSDFEDYIESKANLRQFQLKAFLENLGYKVKSVLINGSTDWLLTEAKKYTVNMNGSVINQQAYQQENLGVENGNNQD